MIIIDVVFRECYILCDINIRYESREYAQKIFRSIKDVNITLIKNQFDIIYNNIDLKFRRDIKKFKKIITINLYFTNFDDYKHE